MQLEPSNEILNLADSLSQLIARMDIQNLVIDGKFSEASLKSLMGEIALLVANINLSETAEVFAFRLVQLILAQPSLLNMLSNDLVRFDEIESMTIDILEQKKALVELNQPVVKNCEEVRTLIATFLCLKINNNLEKLLQNITETPASSPRLG